MTDIETLHAEALAQGYKDETCSRCGGFFPAHIHFVRCDKRPCPMISTTDVHSLLDRIADSIKPVMEGDRGEV